MSETKTPKNHSFSKEELKIQEEFQKIVQDLSSDDRNRAGRYAQDLLSGLDILKSYPAGVSIFGSARLPETSKYYIAARKLGAALAAHGHTVITGGGPGVMEAANRGAFESGGRSIGLNITLPHEQMPNPYLTDTLTFRYFFARKVILAMSANIYVFFPGGFGTMDEFTEILILMQEGKMRKMPMFLYGKSFWRQLDFFYATQLTRMEVIKKEDRKIYTLTDSIDEIVKTADEILDI